jgi:hypothetical protein
MADTTTTAYGLTKPEVGASEDTWGTKLNTDLDSLDTIINAIGGKTAAGTLSYADSAKLVTTSGGVDITGALTASTSLNIASSTTVDGILDEDDMSSNSATKLATQQSIKAYVDAQVGTVDTLAEVLGNGNTTGGTDIVVSANDVISLDAGTNALPSLTTTGDLNTGLYFPAADEVGITTGGTQRVKVDNTGVDITGTLTSDGLTVDGKVLINAPADTLAQEIRGRSSDDVGYLQFSNNAGTTSSYIGSNGSYLNFETSGSEAMRIASNGDISFYEDTGTTAKLVWKAVDERLGIGTDSPKRHLHINDPSAVSTKIQITNSATGSGSDGDGFQLGIGGAGQAAIEQRENQPLTFSTNNIERMRIDSSGHAIIPAGVTLGTAAGVYAAANTLDDYEEGIATLTMGGGTSNPSSTQSTNGYYTKIGNVVKIWFLFSVKDNTGASGVVEVDGLPFTVSATQDGYGTAWSGRDSAGDTNSKLWLAQLGTTSAKMVTGGGNNITWASTGSGTYQGGVIHYRTA